MLHPPKRLFLETLLFWLAAFLLIMASLILLEQANPKLINVISVQGQYVHAFTRKPYIINAVPRTFTNLLVDIDYTAGQNSSFFISPVDGCIQHMWVQPPSADKVIMLPGHEEAVCGSDDPNVSYESRSWIKLDLAPYLEPGVNRVTLEVTSDKPNARIEFDPQLYGTHRSSSLACLGLCIAAAMGVFRLARYMGLDRCVALIAVAGMGYYAFDLHDRPNFAYTPDFRYHLKYLEYLLHNWTQPYAFDDGERYHPPTYYYIAAAIYRLFTHPANPINPLFGVRMLSLGFYMVFCLYGLRTLCIAVEKKGALYYMGCGMIVFWPVGIMTATNINNDIASYAAWGAAFYYLVRGMKYNTVRDFQAAVGLLGLTFMIKSTAFILAGIIGIGVIYVLATRRLPLRALLSPQSLIAGGIALLGLAVSFGRVVYMRLSRGEDETYLYFGGAREDVFPLSFYTSFDLRDFIAAPYAKFLGEHGFLNYYLKSMLYEPWGRYDNFLWLPNGMNGLLILVMSITAALTLLNSLRSRAAFEALLPHISAVVMAFIGIIVFTVLERYQFCMNFRYVLPTLVPMVVLYVKAMENVQSRLLYYGGCAAGVVLPVMSLVLYSHRII